MPLRPPIHEWMTTADNLTQTFYLNLCLTEHHIRTNFKDFSFTFFDGLGDRRRTGKLLGST
jgi:hypothetical protein